MFEACTCYQVARKETSPTDEEETDTIAFPELKLIKTNTIACFFSSHLITSTCSKRHVFNNQTFGSRALDVQSQGS